jgi:GTPase SAR1 family protein
MILLIEGLSQVGKTTLINKYIQQYNNSAVRFKGSGAVNVGMQSRWQEYNFWMHNIIERMDQLNDYKILILWDRGLTDVVYTEDGNYSAELLRVIKSHIKKAVIYIDAPITKLTERNTKEGHENTKHRDRYEDVIKSFPLHRITLSGDCLITDEHVFGLNEFIKSLS